MKQGIETTLVHVWTCGTDFQKVTEKKKKKESSIIKSINYRAQRSHHSTILLDKRTHKMQNWEHKDLASGRGS